MRLLIVILCFTLLEGSPSSTCRAALEQCSRSTLTHGACGNSLYRMQLDAIRHDVDRDCYITPDDVKQYAKEFLDQDSDNMVCRSEYIDAEQVRYSYSEAMLSEIWYHQNHDTDCVSIDNFNNGNQPVPLDSYITNMVELYSQYCGRGRPNLRDDALSCSIIVNLCMYDYRHLQACIEFMSQDNPPKEHRKPLWEKLELHARDLDDNHDGISTVDETDYFFIHKLDADNDGCADMEESVSYWLATYNLTEEYTRYNLERLPDANNNNCFDGEDFSDLPAEGIPAHFVTLNMVGQIGEMCEEKNSYSTNIDCAGLAFLCKQHLPEQEQCSSYTDCGLQSYSQCASQLKETGYCSSKDDKRYIDAELRSVDSLIVRFCTPADTDAGSQLFATWSSIMIAILAFLHIIR